LAAHFSWFQAQPNSLIKIQAAEPEFIFVMPGLVPGIRVLITKRKVRRGWPGPWASGSDAVLQTAKPGHDELGKLPSTTSTTRKLVATAAIATDDPSLCDRCDGKTAANWPAGRLTIKIDL
jgi:hypothetical protein